MKLKGERIARIYVIALPFLTSFSKCSATYNQVSFVCCVFRFVPRTFVLLT